MTLIVGVLCTDGVVVGADGAATYGALGQRTVRQPVEKIDIVQGAAIIGVSGPVGVGQQFRACMEDLWPKKLAAVPKAKAASNLRDKLWGALHPQVAIAAAVQPIYGQGLSMQSVSCATLVAFPCNKHPALVQLTEQCQPEFATENLPFVAIGSGQAIADPFLALLRRIYWPERTPTLQEGVFAACWTLHHAIVASPGGVADPKQITVLEAAGGEWKARQLEEIELVEHLQFVAGAEKHMADFAKKLVPAEEAPPEETPPAPPAKQG